MSGKPQKGMLFLCVANSARSQIAEGWARRLAPKELVIWSAGSQATIVSEYAKQVMSEVGIDIGKQWSKSVHEVPLGEVDLVITLCADEVCPPLPAGIEHRHWPMPDPGGAESFRSIRDQIKLKLEALFA